MSDYTVIGAGAIGGIVGAALIGAGHTVRFIEANRAHVDAVRASGLRISGYRDVTVHAPIATPEEADWPLARVLLAVKSRHTVEALAPFAGRIDPAGFVLSLQNGLEEYRIVELVGRQRTIGAFLTFGGHYKAPGEIVHGGPGTFCIGEVDGAITPRLRALQRDLAALQPVNLTGNIFGYLWAKAALGAIYFATAIADADVTDLYAVPDHRALFGSLAGEVVAVADAYGVTLESFDGFDPAVFRPGSPADEAAIAATWQGQIDYWNRHSVKRTGVWRDLAIHKRKTEADRLLGAVVERARQRNIPIPRVEALLRLVTAVESGEQPLGVANFAAIEAAANGLPAGSRRCRQSVTNE
jgi:2-dehydropantoate 2-reductase